MAYEAVDDVHVLVVELSDAPGAEVSLNIEPEALNWHELRGEGSIEDERNLVALTVAYCDLSIVDAEVVEEEEARLLRVS